MESNTDAAGLLTQLLRHEFRSPLRYLLGAAPYVGSLRAVSAYRLLQRISQEDLDHVCQLTQRLYQSGGVPPASGPPIEMASEHYVALEYVLPKLIEYKSSSVEFYQQLAQQRDCRQLAQIAELRQRQLRQLLDLQAQ